MNRYHAIALFLGLNSLLAFGAHGALAQTPADDNQPVIRQFDIPTVEKLGRAMYEQDQFAWKATDIALAHFTEDGYKAQNARGWLVETTPAGSVVRFVRETPDGPAFFYDVTFPANGTPKNSVPVDAALTSEELAQWGARKLAIENITQRCSDTYNTIILKDPERGGWLVWVMAASKDPRAIVLGGHYRFSFSDDGKNIVGKDRLSKSCLIVSRPDAASGMPAAIIGQQFVSPTPLETTVFASLSYKETIIIGTLDGTAWKFDGDRISKLDMDSAGTDGFAARELVGMDEKCKIIATKLGEVPPKYYVQGDVSVVEPTEKSDAFRADAADGYKAVSVMCGRPDIAPMPNDYKVLLAGYTLFIVENGTGHSKRTGVLEISGGQFQFRTTSGDPLTHDQQVKVGARLDAFQNAIQNK